MNKKVLTQVESVKLPLRVKLLFASGDFAKTLLAVMTMGFSLYFYTDICGINPNIAATIILIAKIWDFVNDPMMGAIVDKTVSKEGKCRFYLKYFSVPAGVVLALSFMMPELSATGKIVWVAVTYILQGMASTALVIPMNTLMGRMTSDPVERASLNAYKGYFNIASNLIVGSVTIPLVMALGKGDMKTGFMYVAIIYSVIYALLHLVVFWGTKGYEPLEQYAEHAPETPAQAGTKAEKPRGSVAALFKNTPWLICVGLYFMLMLANSLGGSTMMWYCQYNLGNVNIYSVLSMVGCLAGIPVYVFLGTIVKHLGNAKTAVLGSAMAAIGYGVRFLLHDSSIAVLVAGYAIGSIGYCLVSAIIMLLIFDSGVYGKWKTGVDNEALLVSGYSLSYKVGMALASPLAGYLLGAVPYVANAATQEQSVLNLFFYENTLIAAVGFIVATLVALPLIKYEKMLPKMREEIALREADEK